MVHDVINAGRVVGVVRVLGGGGHGGGGRHRAVATCTPSHVAARRLWRVVVHERGLPRRPTVAKRSMSASFKTGGDAKVRRRVDFLQQGRH